MSQPTSRITKIRENWKVKEQQINHLKKMRDGDLSLECGLPIDKKVANKLFRHSLAERNLWELEATLKATYEENLKEAESMLVELKNELEWNESLTAVRCNKDCDVGKLFFKIKLRHKKIIEQKAEWQKLRDEIKLKLKELR